MLNHLIYVNSFFLMKPDYFKFIFGVLKSRIASAEQFSKKSITAWIWWNLNLTLVSIVFTRSFFRNGQVGWFHLTVTDFQVSFFPTNLSLCLYVLLQFIGLYGKGMWLHSPAAAHAILKTHVLCCTPTTLYVASPFAHNSAIFYTLDKW